MAMDSKKSRFFAADSDSFKRIAPLENWNWNCFGCLQIYDIYIYIFVYRDERERPLFYWVMVCMVCTSPVDLLDKMLKRSRLLPTWPCQKSQGEQGGIIIAMVNSD